MIRRGVYVSVGLLAAGAAALTSCSSSSSSSSSTTSAAASSASSSQSSASSSPATSESSSAAAGAPFGAGCASLGVSQAALAVAANAPIGVAAAAVPILKTVVTAATVAGLVPTLNAAPALTVFAPEDSAFAKEPAGLLQSLLTDPTKKATLVATLKYHVIAGKLDKTAVLGKHATLQGTDVTVAGSGDALTVNNAKIVCGGIQTKNAVVYVIDTVLHPAS
jgi:uncharacterized surface protein with fasciclin (FAS1) repeats